MTTAPKLIREQLLALANRIRDTAKTLRFSDALAKAHNFAKLDEYADELLSLAAEPVGGETDGVASAAYEAAQEVFAEYFARNYPGPSTIFCDPNWHAPKLFKAAYRAFIGAAEAEIFLRGRVDHQAEPTQPDSAEGECRHEFEVDTDYPAWECCQLCGQTQNNLRATEDRKGEIHPADWDRHERPDKQPKAEGVEALVPRWRRYAENGRATNFVATFYLDQCANELEAALSAAPQPEQKKSHSDHGSIAHRLYCELGFCGGEPACFFGADQSTQDQWTDAVDRVLGQLSQPEQPARDGDEVEQLRARIQTAWHNHDVDGRVLISMADAMLLVEKVLQPPQQADGGAVAAHCQEFVSMVGDEFGNEVGARLRGLFQSLCNQSALSEHAKVVGYLAENGNEAFLFFANDSESLDAYTADGFSITPLIRQAATHPPKSPGVTDEMVSRALDAQPFIDKNDATRVWQLISHDNNLAVMRAALLAALGGEK